MNIMLKEPTSNGAYSQIHEQDCTSPPDGYYEVAYGVELSCGGLGTLTIENDIVTGFTPDAAAWEKWQAEHQPTPPEPTTEEKQMEQIRAQNATIAMMSSVISDLIADVEALKV